MIWKAFTLHLKFVCGLNRSKKGKFYWFFLSSRTEDLDSDSSGKFRVGLWNWKQQQNSIMKMHKQLWGFLFLLSPDQWEFSIQEGVWGSCTQNHKSEIGVVSTKTALQDISLDSSKKSKMYPEDFSHTWATEFWGVPSCLLSWATVEKVFSWWLLWQRNGKHAEAFVPAGSWVSWEAPDSLKSGQNVQ